MAITDKFDIARKRDQSVATWDKLKTDFSNHPGSHGALIVTSLVLITPVALTFLLTTQTTAQVYDLDHMAPGGLDVMYQNYYQVLIEWSFWRLLVNTTIVAGVTTIGGIVLSLFAALAIVFYDVRFRQAAFYRRSRPSASGLDPEGEGRKLG